MIRIAFVTLLSVLTFFANAQLLDPVKWTFDVKEIGNKQVELTFIASIEGKWHMYGQNIPEGGPIATSFNFNDNDNFKLIGKTQDLQKPEKKYDSTFGMELELFNGTVKFKQTVEILTDKSFDITGYVEYMCCDDERCLPPKEAEFTFNISDKLISQVSKTEESPDTESKGSILGKASENVNIISQQQTQETSESVIESSDVELETIEEENEVKESSSLWQIFLWALGGGLLGLLTPCVYPMIPMTVSFFMRGEKTRQRAISEGLFFGFSIVLVYTAIGVLISLTKSDFTTTLNTHWLPNVVFFSLFLVFAMSFFGMFELVLPTSWANKVDQKVDKGGILGPFFMALTTVIVSFSCTGPIVGALLVKAAQGEVLEPVIGMLGFSLIFALPFTLFAIFPGMVKGLPKSGGWLNSVKVVLGFVVLAFGFKFISNIDQAYHLNILSRQIFVALWVVIFTLLGFYLLGKIKFSHDSELKHLSVPRLFLAIASFTFVLYLIPGLFGAPLSKISSFLPPADEEQVTLFSTEKTVNSPDGNICSQPKYADMLHLPHGLQGYFTLEEAQACAKELNKPIFYDFKGHFCSNCKKMESTVWTENDVLRKLREEFVIVAFYTDDKTKLPENEWYVSDNDGKEKKTLGKQNEDFQVSQFGTNTIPLYAIVDANGKLLTENTFGYKTDKEAFLDFLDEGISNYKQSN